MTDRNVVEALNEHAARLLAGREGGADLAAGLDAVERRSLDSLVLVARRLKAALVPLEVRPEFRAELGSQLRAAAAGAADRRRDGLVWVAGAGGLLYLVGLAFISFRTGAAAMGKVSGIIAAGRAARAAVPEAQPAP